MVRSIMSSIPNGTSRSSVNPTFTTIIGSRSSASRTAVSIIFAVSSTSFTVPSPNSVATFTTLSIVYVVFPILVSK